MSTCGYLCPKCEGANYLENGEPCDWCKVPIATTNIQTKNNDEEIEAWLKQVHEGPCCSDSE